jgi:aryl-alcohol dehydrogenase-like predicted oxidoreductase/AcrR family transcriptional regulator
MGRRRTFSGVDPTASGERSRAGRPTSTEAARLTDRLRRAAVDTFLEHGYDGTTMEAVAQAAGVTKSTLYARYPDKRTLFMAVSSWALTRQERDDRVVEPLPGDLAAALTSIARSILARSVDPDIVRLSRMAIAESGRFPEFAANTQAVTWSPRIGVIMDLLRRHERAGTVAVGDVEIAAEQFFAMVGAMPSWLAAHGIHRTPEVEERHIEHAVELFLNGLLVRGAPAPAAPVPSGGAPPEPRGASPDPMEVRRLGRSGLLVSRLALGTASFGTRDCDERTASALVHRFLDAGGNLIDVSGGAAEEICGRALRDRRPQVVLAAATWAPAGEDARRAGNGRRRIRAACEASLRRLRTDHIDLYQLAFDDPATPLEETIDALDGLVRAGKVLYVGVAGFPAYRLMKALSISDRREKARFAALRSRYDPMARNLEREHLPLLEEEGMGLITEAPPADGPVAAVAEAAARLGCTPAQLALAWQLSGPATATIIEARTTDRLEEDLAAANVRLPADLAAELDRLTRPPAAGPPH